MKTTTISDFKAHISENLREVRAGARITIVDRNTPVAEVGPIRGDVGQPATVKARKAFAVPGRPDWTIAVDVADLLRQERGAT